MKRTALAFGAALALLGGCAPYATSGAYYGGGGYYQPDYYGPDRAYVPYGGYGGGYARGYHRDNDRGYRGPDHDRGDRRSDNDRGNRSNSYQGNRQNRPDNARGDNQPRPQSNAQADGGYRMPNGDRITRGNFWQQQPQQNAAPQSGAPQPGGDGGSRMGRHRTD